MISDENNQKSCCGASSKSAGLGDDLFLKSALEVPLAADDVKRDLRDDLVLIPGGIFEMGARKSTYAADLDSPRRKVKVSQFHMAPTSVTNQQYARFVEATGYRTVAEQTGWSFVFHLLLNDTDQWNEHPPGLPWWRRVDGACWATPQGPNSDWRDKADHPAVHICWFDAMAYCTWAGLRLPWEAEWERAARGGHPRRKFPWGNSLMPNGQYAMNTWQGIFPNENTADDGFLGTAPVTSFEKNSYGMWNMTGNVWEWAADYFGGHAEPGAMPEIDPTGPVTGHARVQRGGSFLCHVSYCDRYHVHSRTRNDPDSGTSNSGFRVAFGSEQK